MKNIKLGLLEFGNRHRDQSSMHSVLDVLEYAERADELGFSRFWLGEHHLFNAMAPWSSPQMLLPLLLQQTDRIKVGMAGVLMNFYSPYHVACDFKLLANLFPGRCDLGFANGRPAPRIGRQMRCEQFAEYPDDFTERVQRVATLLHDEHRIMEEEQTMIPPVFGGAPELFWLGSSFRKYPEAIRGQMHMVKSTFHDINSLNYEEYDIIARYREEFRAQHGYQPRAIIALVGICQEDERRLQAAKERLKKQGKGTITPNTVVGPPELFLERIDALSRRYGVDEFVIFDTNERNEEKLESLELLSKAFQLPAVGSNSARLSTPTYA